MRLQTASNGAPASDRRTPYRRSTRPRDHASWRGAIGKKGSRLLWGVGGRGRSRDHALLREPADSALGTGSFLLNDAHKTRPRFNDLVGSSSSTKLRRFRSAPTHGAVQPVGRKLIGGVELSAPDHAAWIRGNCNRRCHERAVCAPSHNCAAGGFGIG
jgi:hypothetical protein